ncbi:AraC family transcriptional regulator [Asticcacaulis sp. BYS171W]|uniref:AraC family transcriptional regulator n=1 Tax=Asticcacaulis aquaticus TaxID=2984212 RepID=A0ABT5HX34_9CAUL|nr:AraC family transcriptional regulator [Asticcacaulis aquaticus]MDC7684646.1 AraC family transcriptional regulator [Asticcacaulis aquaticus]
MESLSRLSDILMAHTPGSGTFDTAWPRLFLIRSDQPTEPMPTHYVAAACVMVQGAKQVLVGDRLYAYRGGQYLTVSVDVPATGQVTLASPDKPYLCLMLTLDAALLGDLILGLEAPPSGEALEASLRVDEVDERLADACLRLAALLDRPRDLAVLGPLVEREILYLLLQGEQGRRLRQIATADGRLTRVTRAIRWLKDNYSRPFRMAALTEAASMSASSLHAHFKAVTLMSPLQYHKQLRLQEARQLIFMQGMDAADAGHSVGYDSPSQFSREYKRLFGAPPIRDAALWVQNREHFAIAEAVS